MSVPTPGSPVLPEKLPSSLDLYLAIEPSPLTLLLPQLAIATLTTLFGGAYLMVGGKKAPAPTPPINASSTDELDFIKYGFPLRQADRDTTNNTTGSLWRVQMRTRRRRSNRAIVYWAPGIPASARIRAVYIYRRLTKDNTLPFGLPTLSQTSLRPSYLPADPIKTAIIDASQSEDYLYLRRSHLSLARNYRE